MIVKRHLRTVTLMNRDPLTSFLVRDYFDLPRRETLTWCLLSRRLGQADLVLCLLRLRDGRAMRDDHHRLLSYYIRRLVGRPILVGEPCLLRYRSNGSAPRTTRPTTSADRRLAWVNPTNPRHPGTEAHLRWMEFKPGRTVAQLRARGITRRDLRRAERLGWVRFEEVTA
jgi:hypothetical protein